MKFLSAAHTDVGIRKKVNQDAFCLKTAHTGDYNIAFAVLCDGMGGLKMGELASAFTVNAFSNWFEKVLPQNLRSGYNAQQIEQQWRAIVENQSKLIMDYGMEKGVSLGTTLTAILICGTEYIAVHVGDSRLYRIDSQLTQLTEDHSLVAMEVRQGKITPEMAKTDRRRNVLLQCVGASETVEPQILTSQVQSDQVYMLCSDGFRHKLAPEEIFGVFAPEVLNDERVMRKSIIDLININKTRGENDNITSILIKCTE